MRRYVCRARGSVLQGLIVYRCPAWPWIDSRGNVLVMDFVEFFPRLNVTPGRALRRLNDA